MSATEQPPDVPSPETPAAGASIDELADQPALSLPREFLLFLRENKKWWLAPIILVLLAAVVVVAVSSSAAAPWIYTLF
jgi:hypothetical protein